MACALASVIQVASDSGLFVCLSPRWDGQRSQEAMRGWLNLAEAPGGKCNLAASTRSIVSLVNSCRKGCWMKSVQTFEMNKAIVDLVRSSAFAWLWVRLTGGQLGRGVLLCAWCFSTSHLATASNLGMSGIATPLQVGFVYISPIGVSGWTFEHEQARKRLEVALHGQVSTSYVESVSEGVDAERVMRDFVRQGKKLIFATSFGYQEAVLRVAAESPHVIFEHAGGYRTGTNLNNYNVRLYEARWLSGYLAGRSSKTGVAGYVAGFPVPEVVQGINAFTLGMRAANPGARVRVLWLNKWFDPPREREAALSLINGGADVLTHHTGSSAVVQVAEAHGVKAIAYQSDMSHFAPQAHLGAVTVDWTNYYIKVARSVMDGTWRPSSEWGGTKEGMVSLTALSHSVPAETRREISRMAEGLKIGSTGPFTGRLVDQRGETRLANGQLSDAEIFEMDWFVEGVVGTLSRK